MYCSKGSDDMTEDDVIAAFSFWRLGWNGHWCTGMGYSEGRNIGWKGEAKGRAVTSAVPS